MNYKFLFVGLLALAACTSNVDEQSSEKAVTDITMTLNEFKSDKQSRTSLVVDEKGAHFQWTEKDTVGVFPDKGMQSDFPIGAGAGSSKAVFDGGGWALKPSSHYAAYCPFIKSVDFDRTCVPVNYEGQTQTGNHSTAHIGAYDYNAAAAITPDKGRVNFSFEHLGVLVKLKMKLPKGNYSALILSSTEDIYPLRGTFDLSQNPIKITPDPKSMTKIFKINLKDFEIVKDEEDVLIYFMCPPVDLRNKTVMVSIKSDVATLRGGLTIKTAWEAGYSYSLTLDQANLDNQWVDLGLPSGTLWADHNVGAVYPEDLGAFFTWGSTDRIIPTSSAISYFNADIPASVTDISGNPEYDPAAKYWGAPARIPTYTEMQELVANCTWNWTEKGYSKGYLVTGPNKRTIYLPAGGYVENGNVYNFQKASPQGYYWSSTRNGGFSYYLSLYSTGKVVQSFLPGNGMSIRPVSSKAKAAK